MLKIYLETTIFNFPFVNDAPQYKDATLILWQQIKEGLFAPYTTDAVINELQDATEPLKSNMIKLIIVKMKTKIMCSAINALYGLKAPYIFAPQEVIDYERETHL